MRGEFSPILPNRANRRRLRVFAWTLVVCLALGLGITWLRSAEYRVSARLEIEPGTRQAPAEPTAGAAPESVAPFLTEVQILTSRPILGETAVRLERAGQHVGGAGPDTVASMQSHLEAIRVPNTNVVELVATGPRPESLAPLVNTVIDVYRDRLAAAHRDSSAEALAQASEETKRLETAVASMRQDVEAFRIRNNIVSLERNENQVLTQTRELGTSLGAANERVAKAEGKLQALSASAAAGNSVVRSKDDPTLANLEQRASLAREQLLDLDRDFTPDYLAKDPRATALRARLAELERQIAVQREVGKRAALAEAQEELAGAQSTATRIQSQIATGQKEVGQFTSRFNEYKAQQGQLDALEKAHQEAARRLATLDATARARMPTIKVLEAAATPREAWWPNYWRDTGISVGASLALALLAMWLVELFNRTEPQPTVVLVQPPSAGVAYAATPNTLARHDAAALPRESSAQPLLPQQPALPRELERDEVARLVMAADDESRLTALLLLRGIGLDEMIALRASDFDLVRRVINVGGGSARAVPIDDPLRSLVAARIASSGALLVHLGQPANRESVATQLLCAAHDAGIERAMEVTAECLRHTYVAFLVRQGIRFADLTTLVGPMPAELLGAYSALAPAGQRRPLQAIDVVYPASPPDASSA